MWFLPLIRNWKLVALGLAVAALAFLGYQLDRSIQATGRAKQYAQDVRVLNDAYRNLSGIAVAQRDSVAKQLDSLKQSAPKAIIRWRTVTQHDGTTVTPADSSRHQVPLPDSVIVAGNELADQLGKCLSGCDQFRADTKVKEKADSVRYSAAESRLDSAVHAGHAGAYVKAGAVGAVLGAVAAFALRHR